LPPDVRQRLCPADSSQIYFRAMPLGSGFVQVYWAKGRTKGIAQR
jgi:hypothetical protein